MRWPWAMRFPAHHHFSRTARRTPIGDWSETDCSLQRGRLREPCGRLRTAEKPRGPPLLKSGTVRLSSSLLEHPAPARQRVSPLPGERALRRHVVNLAKLHASLIRLLAGRAQVFRKIRRTPQQNSDGTTPPSHDVGLALPGGASSTTRRSKAPRGMALAATSVLGRAWMPDESKSNASRPPRPSTT